MMKTLAIDLIVTDAGTQMRAGTRMETVKEYTELASKEGWTFTTPLVVFFDGERYFLADGFHRYEACMLAKRASVMADIRRGTLRDAIKFALGANQTHGLRRSNDDKRNAVLVALNDAEWGKMSNRAIGEMCGVSNVTVMSIRNESKGSTAKVEQLDEPETRIGKDGKERRLPAAKAKSEPKPEPESPKLPDDLPPDWPFDDERPADEQPEQPEQPDDQQEAEAPATRSKKNKVEPTDQEKASLLKSAIKQHNAAMMRLIDDLSLIDPNKKIHERMLQRFRDNHEDMESWK